MLIKHFNDLTKLIDVKVTDFTDLRHNCWADVGTMDRRRLAAMQASSVWRLDTHDCLLAERGNIGPKLVNGNVFICRVTSA